MKLGFMKFTISILIFAIMLMFFSPPVARAQDSIRSGPIEIETCRILGIPGAKIEAHSATTIEAPYFIISIASIASVTFDIWPLPEPAANKQGQLYDNNTKIEYTTYTQEIPARYASADCEIVRHYMLN